MEILSIKRKSCIPRKWEKTKRHAQRIKQRPDLAQYYYPRLSDELSKSLNFLQNFYAAKVSLCFSFVGLYHISCKSVAASRRSATTTTISNWKKEELTVTGCNHNENDFWWLFVKKKESSHLYRYKTYRWTTREENNPARILFLFLFSFSF